VEEDDGGDGGSGGGGSAVDGRAGAGVGAMTVGCWRLLDVADPTSILLLLRSEEETETGGRDRLGSRAEGDVWGCTVQ